jgi:hypothetical protein
MQKKASYRLLKWTLLLGTVASMATACVVTSGDGDDDDFDFGGEGGTSSSSAGKASTGGAGTSSTAGKTSTGGTGGSATAGSSTGGTGGAAEEIGVCMGTDSPEPTSLPNCDPDAKDEADPCRKCVRAKCCTEYKTCFGDEPRIACGWGPNADDGFAGQYECILACFDKEIATSAEDPNDIIAGCSGECLQQCESDNVIMDATSDLIGCANDSCTNECFPVP